MKNSANILICGVGGQGVLLFSDVLSGAALTAGFDVKKSEVHGMAQRGGSVIGQIRYGKKVYSPLVARGTARVLCALEQIEALRYAEYLAPGGLVVVNSQTITPVTVSMGAAKYPKDVEAKLRSVFPRLIYFDAGKRAVEVGDIRAANVVLLGALSTGLDLPMEAWKQAIEDSVKPKFREMNLKAFDIGRSCA